ncbi:hypothetical protein ATANTOWER_011466, partial [Ataeniobius toweri]|nr:hypothetical protein [Ataeniobius toweri]
PTLRVSATTILLSGHRLHPLTGYFFPSSLTLGPPFLSPPLSFSTDYLFIAGCTASSQLTAKEPVFPSYTDPSFKAELFPGKLRHCSRGPHCASLKVTTNPLTRGEV